MKTYPNARKGLLIIITSVGLLILFSILSRFIAAIDKSYVFICVLCYIIEFVGLIFCARDRDKNFKYGIIGSIISIITGIIAVALEFVNKEQIEAIGTTSLVFTTIALAANIFVVFFVLRGCISITDDRTVRLASYFSISLTAISTIFYLILVYLSHFNAFPIGGNQFYISSVIYCVIDVFADLMLIFAVVKAFFDLPAH